jgi:hypothetical protein
MQYVNALINIQLRVSMIIFPIFWKRQKQEKNVKCNNKKLNKNGKSK